MDLGRIMGVGRAGLLAGAAVVTIATFASAPTLAWGGVALAAVSIAVNAAGKVTHYARVGVPAAHRALVVGAWLLLVGCVLALIVDYARSQFTPGYEGYFWSLAVAAAGLAMVYQGLRSKLVRDVGSAAPDG